MYNRNDSPDLSRLLVSKLEPGVAPFLKSLRTILHNENKHIMRWTPDGKAFEILDMDMMTDLILPKYFKHRKYASFQRQLNYFNFRKWTKSKATICTFSNKFFVRDDPTLAWRITRKKVVQMKAHTRKLLEANSLSERNPIELKSGLLRAPNKVDWSVQRNDSSRYPVPIPLRMFSLLPRPYTKMDIYTYPESSQSAPTSFYGHVHPRHDHPYHVSGTHQEEPFPIAPLPKFTYSHMNNLRHQPIEPTVDPLDWVDTFLPSLDVHFMDRNADKLKVENRMLMT